MINQVWETNNSIHAFVQPVNFHSFLPMRSRIRHFGIYFIWLSVSLILLYASVCVHIRSYCQWVSAWSQELRPGHAVFRHVLLGGCGASTGSEDSLDLFICHFRAGSLRLCCRSTSFPSQWEVAGGLWPRNLDI